MKVKIVGPINLDRIPEDAVLVFFTEQGEYATCDRSYLTEMTIRQALDLYYQEDLCDSVLVVTDTPYTAVELALELGIIDPFQYEMERESLVWPDVTDYEFSDEIDDEEDSLESDDERESWSSDSDSIQESESEELDYLFEVLPVQTLRALQLL